MAHENIQLTYPNFCLGPVPGTICTVNTSDVSTVLRIKNTAGAIVDEYSFSANIVNSVEGLEYIGPPQIASIIDGLTFFTLERVNSAYCIIKRWETRTAFKELNLKEQIIKTSSGDERYDVHSFAVEYDTRTVRNPNENYAFVDLNSADGIKTGTKLYFGPSRDADNPGAVEVVTVSHVGQVSDGLRVYLNSPLKYQYLVGDRVTFYRYVYLISRIGYAGDTSVGSMYKLDAYTWNTVEINSKAIYRKIESARWCHSVRAIASVLSTNVLFIRPYDSYVNWRSFFLDNFLENKVDTYDVVDIIFDGDNIYRLQNAITIRADDGKLTSYSWNSFNFQQDTLIPYNNNMNVWMEQSIVTGYSKSISINATVKDQYFVGLRDVEIQFSMLGDDDANFVPLSGWVTTDTNGDALVGYISGFEYYGHTLVRANAGGGSTFKGSQEVWSENNILSYPDFQPIEYKIFQRRGDLTPGQSYLRQLNDYYKIVRKNEYGDLVFADPHVLTINRSYFTTPGGEWADIDDLRIDTMNPMLLADWLPQLYRGEGNQLDAPVAIPHNNTPFSNWPYPPIPDYPPTAFPIPNQIRLTEDFESEVRMKALTDFLIYDDLADPLSEGRLPDIKVVQPDETGSKQLSQLKLSLHTHWVDGEPYDDLQTYVNINQFIFVEDAVPKFYSNKNPTDTDIWIRLRPFAFSLDNNTFRMWVREVSYAGDTGYVEVTDNVQLSNFDAGGGLLGTEVLYNPSVDFHYNATVFVRIEIYDEAYIPNFVYIDYWFNIIPDYTAPYLTNLYPSREQQNVSVDTEISFDIYDIGTGLDPDSLECLLNSRLMDPDYLTIDVVSTHHIKVTYQPPQNLYFNKNYKVTVKIQDTAPNQNKTIDSWRFYTAESSAVIFTDFFPKKCKRGMERFTDVHVTVLAGGEGLDKDSIRMQVYDKDVKHKLVPIIYRIS
jgi:hypothetical protein